jgi:hypothetical protein
MTSKNTATFKTEEASLEGLEQVAGRLREALDAAEAKGLLTCVNVMNGKFQRAFNVGPAKRFECDYDVRLWVNVKSSGWEANKIWRIEIGKLERIRYPHKRVTYKNTSKKNIDKMVAKMVAEAASKYQAKVSTDRLSKIYEDWQAAGKAALENAGAPEVPMLRVNVDQPDRHASPTPETEMRYRVEFARFDLQKRLFTAGQVAKLARCLAEISGLNDGFVVRRESKLLSGGVRYKFLGNNGYWVDNIASCAFFSRFDEALAALSKFDPDGKETLEHRAEIVPGSEVL